MNKPNTSRLKVEIVHDMVCSWCPIGYLNMQTAIKQLQIEVDFQFLPFELNPHMPEEGQTIPEYFKQHFRWTDNKLRQYQNELVETARQSGVNIDFSKRTHYFNTHNAHKLMYWAHGFEKQTAFNESLIKAYFEQGLNINQPEVLLSLMSDIELDPKAAKLALESQHIEHALMDKIKRYMPFNITTIPTFILNGHHVISGANSVTELTHHLIDYQTNYAA